MKENPDLNLKIDSFVLNFAIFFIISIDSSSNMKIMHSIKITMAGNTHMSRPVKKNTFSLFTVKNSIKNVATELNMMYEYVPLKKDIILKMIQ